MKCRTYNRKKILIVFLSAAVILAGLIGRLAYLMIFEADYYQELAQDLHERERPVKAARGVYHIGDSQSDQGDGTGD